MILPDKTILKKRYIGLMPEGVMIFFSSKKQADGIYKAKKLIDVNFAYMKTIKIEKEVGGFLYEVSISKKDQVYRLKFEDDKETFKEWVSILNLYVIRL